MGCRIAKHGDAYRLPLLLLLASASERPLCFAFLCSIHRLGALVRTTGSDYFPYSYVSNGSFNRSPNRFAYRCSEFLGVVGLSSVKYSNQRRRVTAFSRRGVSYEEYGGFIGSGPVLRPVPGVSVSSLVSISVTANCYADLNPCSCPQARSSAPHWHSKRVATVPSSLRGMGSVFPHLVTAYLAPHPFFPTMTLPSL